MLHDSPAKHATHFCAFSGSLAMFCHFVWLINPRAPTRKTKSIPKIRH
jgi:hypothetical protein